MTPSRSATTRRCEIDSPSPPRALTVFSRRSRTNAHVVPRSPEQTPGTNPVLSRSDTPSASVASGHPQADSLAVARVQNQSHRRQGQHESIERIVQRHRLSVLAERTGEHSPVTVSVLRAALDGGQSPVDACRRVLAVSERLAVERPEADLRMPLDGHLRITVVQQHRVDRRDRRRDVGGLL